MVHVITSLFLFHRDSVGIVEGKDGSIYEITSAKTIHYIDQVQKLYRDDGIGKGMKEISNLIRIGVILDGIMRSNLISLCCLFVKMLSNIDQLFYFQRIGRGGGFCLVWRNGKKTSFTTAIPDEVEELVEVISSHLKKFKQSAGNIHFPFQSISLSIYYLSLPSYN